MLVFASFIPILPAPFNDFNAPLNELNQTNQFKDGEVDLELEPEPCQHLPTPPTPHPPSPPPLISCSCDSCCPCCVAPTKLHLVPLQLLITSPQHSSPFFSKSIADHPLHPLTLLPPPTAPAGCLQHHQHLGADRISIIQSIYQTPITKKKPETSSAIHKMGARGGRGGGGGGGGGGRGTGRGF